jgi:tRNA threonylcarbamoyladenosine biosynthesis protein TsaB
VDDRPARRDEREILVIVLALDTATREGSVALRSADTLLGWSTGDPERPHGERLPGELLALLSVHETDLCEVEIFAVCTGPGSFTGLRVGLATIQGVALATGRPVIAVPTLEALAHAGLEQLAPQAQRLTLIVPWMDAYRGEVFGAVYRVNHEGVVTEHHPAAVGTTDVLLQELAPILKASPVLFVGNAVEGARVAIANTIGVEAEVQMLESMPSFAPTVALIAEARGADTAVSPHAIRPVYVRRPYSELPSGQRK